MQAWHNVLTACPNVMGINLKAQPHGRASWGDSNPSFDWCERACMCVCFDARLTAVWFKQARIVHPPPKSQRTPTN